MESFDEERMRRAAVVRDRIAKGICRACGKEKALPGKQLCSKCEARKNKLKKWWEEHKKKCKTM